MTNEKAKRWDNDAHSVAVEIRGFLETAIKDEGTHVDIGGGDGVADLWVKIGGVEYTITVKKPSKAAA